MKRLSGTIALVYLALVASLPALAADPFAGSWDIRVAHGKDAYTMRLRCKSGSECDLERYDGKAMAAKPDETLSFKSAARFRPDIAANALRYAIEHRAETSPNPEFAALQKLLPGAVNAKTEIDACIGLDDKQPDFFVVCTVRNPAAKKPVLLLFGSLLGLCGQGFCRYVIYPLVKTGP